MARYQYSKLQFDATVKFVAENNRFYKGQEEVVRSSLLSSLEKLAESPGIYMGTMGYFLTKSLEEDENDEAYWFIEIYVDPSLGERNYDENEEWIDSKNESELH